MYIIINNTNGSKQTIEGNWPSQLVDELVLNGNDIIIISKYSNTIKIPYIKEENGIKEVEIKQFHF